MLVAMTWTRDYPENALCHASSPSPAAFYKLLPCFGEISLFGHSLAEIFRILVDTLPLLRDPMVVDSPARHCVLFLYITTALSGHPPSPKSRRNLATNYFWEAVNLFK